MPQLAPEHFAKSMVTAGLTTAEEIKKLWATLDSNSRPKDGSAFARLLIERGFLTEFQAQSLLQGLKLPLVLGDYVLLDKIGAGGMGQVYKAQHRHMKRLVAIKFLSDALTKDEDAVKRFQREVEAAAKLSHPHIVQAHDASMQRGVWYLVMEFVEGSDLASYIRKHGPLSARSAVRYLRQAAEGLAYAHRRGVIHRDIKPSNLLLDSEGTVKVLDMGLARLDSALHSGELTNTGQIMGTIDFMAPEQALNTKNADARADIYSLGMTLWHLLTGKHAYEGGTVVEKLIAHREQPIPSLRASCPHASIELERIFERLVAKNPDDRYQSMNDVVAALDVCPAPADPEPTVNFAGGSAIQPAVAVAKSRTSAAIATAPYVAVAAPPETINLNLAASDTSPSALMPSTKSAKEGKPLWLDVRLLAGAVVTICCLLAAGLYLAINRSDTKNKEVDGQPQAQSLKSTAAKVPWQLTPTAVEQGSIEGRWQLEQDSLVSPVIPFAQFRLPGPPRSRYRCSFAVTREAGQGPLVVGLPVGTEVVVALLDEGPLHETSFVVDSGTLPNRAPKAFAGFPPGAVKHVECTVTDSELRVEIDNELVLQHTSPRQSFATVARWKLADQGGGFLGSSLTRFRFAKFINEPLP